MGTKKATPPAQKKFTKFYIATEWDSESKNGLEDYLTFLGKTPEEAAEEFKMCEGSHPPFVYVVEGKLKLDLKASYK